MNTLLQSALLLGLAFVLAAGRSHAAGPESTAKRPVSSAALAWPEVSQSARPWTRW